MTEDFFGGGKFCAEKEDHVKKVKFVKHHTHLRSSSQGCHCQSDEGV